MTTYSRAVIWFNRVVLAGATFVMTMIALRNLQDPIGATVPLDITLKSPSAVTIVRVGFGGFPLGFAVALCACLIATRRLLTGMFLVLDGATAYNLRLLRPEVAMVTLSAVGIVLELRRRHGVRNGGERGIGLQPSIPR